MESGLDSMDNSRGQTAALAIMIPDLVRQQLDDQQLSMTSPDSYLLSNELNTDMPISIDLDDDELNFTNADGSVMDNEDQQTQQLLQQQELEQEQRQEFSFPDDDVGDQFEVDTKLKSEEEIKDAIRRIDNLYKELLQLRLAAPNLIKALSNFSPNTPPSEVFKTFEKRARDTIALIEKYKRDLAECSDIFQYTDLRQAMDSTDIERSRFDESDDEDNL
ncbi:hypothetical protein V1512DRAFT_257473 [Lipomyces arxii]|uniref:uncharacterized protein n=1 Tax=Lipomyces arxii TaxID=56418 RepID=UPI0034CFE6AA